MKDTIYPMVWFKKKPILKNSSPDGFFSPKGQIIMNSTFVELVQEREIDTNQTHYPKFDK